MNDPADPEDDQQLAMLLATLTDRVQRGDDVDLDEQCRLHPECATELRALWGAVVVANVAGSTMHQTSRDDAFDQTISAFELPHEFGDFNLLEEIGRGGMGIVFRARQISLNREVAIKMILQGSLASATDLERFRAESQAVGKLEHPGIVPVYEVGEHHGQPYFCMKFVAGQTLTEHLAKGLLAPRKVATILAEVSRAIHFAHQRGVLHRDLKPSNVLIDEEGRAQIMDFGLAKQISSRESLTKTGTALGTPAYMSPEQAGGMRAQVGPASDVYSLGTILYQMITGHPPFQAATPVETILMVLDQDPPLPRLVNPQVDRDLEMIALRCLQKPVDLRYESAAALADDLEAYLNDEAISARSGHLWQVCSRLFRETHHAPVLEHWGLLWMWHSLVLFIVCLLTNVLYWLKGTAWDEFSSNRWCYFFLWTAGLGTWAAVFWFLRKRMGPVTFVERQIAHIWGAGMLSTVLLFPVEAILELDVLKLSPVLALSSGMVFLIKGGILTGTFYVQAIVLFLTALVMGQYPHFGPLIFGAVSAACFFLPGLKYHRQRLRSAGKP